MKKLKFDNQPNPWAICTSSVGRDSKDYEACVMKVKKEYGLDSDLTENQFDGRLPIYKLSVAECGDGTCSTEATAIALVTTPAIEVNFVAFSSDNTKPKSNLKSLDFKIQDASKHMLIGPIMLADTPIFRRDPDTGEEYYVTFDSESISNIMKNMMKRGTNKNINIQHNDSDMVDGAYLFEAWQVLDPKVDKTYSYGYKNITSGSFAGTIYCPNDKVWNEYITTGVLRGFSIEGIFEQGSKPIARFNSNKLSPEDEDMINTLVKIMTSL